MYNKYCGHATVHDRPFVSRLSATSPPPNTKPPLPPIIKYPHFSYIVVYWGFLILGGRGFNIRGRGLPLARTVRSQRKTHEMCPKSSHGDRVFNLGSAAGAVVMPRGVEVSHDLLLQIFDLMQLLPKFHLGARAEAHAVGGRLVLSSPVMGLNPKP